MSDRESPPGGGERITLPLLDLITREALESEYREAHARPVDPTADPVAGRVGSRRVTAVVCAVLGVLAVTAAVQTNRNAPVDESSRAALIAQVNDRRENLALLERLRGDLRRTNDDLQVRLEQVIEEELSERNRVRRLQVRTGHLQVRGPGVRIAVDNAEGADPTQVIRDEDLTTLVNGLWQAGAEAISVNGERLTVLSAFRNRGPAILVNSQPLNPPYVVLAIGNTATLQADFANTTSGLKWLNLVHALGFEFTMDNQGSLTLPAARPATLRSVQEGLSTDRDVVDEEIAS
ncbi:DUF881 domain-containing protein [Nocardioides limicola]|uniref:DUF881 domain-containing protein n=1 Tax=Nocardioides limicola TaxID=2803368 RepID=UPI00193B08A6|nr:DUF881 domain-containing protein [Nocardioides sp. DJM-14]